MKTLYIERSAGAGRDGNWTDALELADVSRIVVGTGPGSFAGIRSALAFAQGFALGRDCEVLGLPSPCALARAGVVRAVVGDARRGMRWVAVLDGCALRGEVFQVAAAELASAVPPEAEVVTPDAARLDAELGALFGARYVGGETPSSEGLRAFAEANPAALVPEPLPIYLNPAVRPAEPSVR